MRASALFFAFCVVWSQLFSAEAQTQCGTLGYCASPQPCDPQTCKTGNLCGSSGAQTSGNACPPTNPDPCIIRANCANDRTCGETVRLRCDDGNPCTDNVCIPTPVLGLDIGPTIQYGSLQYTSIQGYTPANLGLIDNLLAPLLSAQCSFPKTAANTPCNDNNKCTTNDVCNGNGACVGGPNPCPALEYPVCYSSSPSRQICAQDGSSQGYSCSFPSGVLAGCNDNNGCTQNDVCSANTVGNGMICSGVLNCDDSIPSTVDTCSPSKVCTHVSSYTDLRAAGSGLSSVGFSSGSAAPNDYPVVVPGIAQTITGITIGSTGRLTFLSSSSGKIYGAGDNNQLQMSASIAAGAVSGFTEIPMPGMVTQISAGDTNSAVLVGTNTLAVGKNGDKLQLALPKDFPGLTSAQLLGTWNSVSLSSASNVPGVVVWPGLQLSTMVGVYYPPKGVSVGREHTLIWSSLTIWAFGGCSKYQCGQPYINTASSDLSSLLHPTAIPLINPTLQVQINVTLLGAGWSDALWTINSETRSYSTPSVTTFVDTWKYAVAGRQGNLALTNNGYVVSWGSNVNGELAIGNAYNPNDNSSLGNIVQITQITTSSASLKFTAISLSRSQNNPWFSLFVTDTGAVYYSGKLGNLPQVYIPVQIPLPGVAIVGASAGSSHGVMWSSQMVYTIGSLQGASYLSPTPIPWYNKPGVTIVTAAAGLDVSLIAATYNN